MQCNHSESSASNSLHTESASAVSERLSALQHLDQAARWQRRYQDFCDEIERFDFSGDERKLLRAVARHSDGMCLPTAVFETSDKLAKAAGIRPDNLQRVLLSLLDEPGRRLRRADKTIEHKGVLVAETNDKAHEFKIQRDPALWHDVAE